MSQDAHADKLAKNKAVLGRQGNKHRENGHSHISGNGGKRAVYDDLMTIRRGLRMHKPKPIVPKDKSVQPWSDQHAEGYTFKHFKAAGANTPYRNQAQHMIPVEFFSVKSIGADELAVMQKVDYDINNGENIIFLPEHAGKVVIHRLPNHCGSHPVYNRVVKTEAARLRQRLQKAIDKDKDHTEWNPPEDIPAELKSLQKSLWNLTVRMVGVGLSNINELEKGKLAPSAGS
ncbi:AHH domain-containing protein [Sorangium sp. So ce834]|uniref:AHH domain-containing protein n=1 Tax=Sorangium sp. So ce834 TaxID=3133321 RepID=UPI003F602E09